MRSFGRYELIEPIASGGMAEVWLAAVAGPAGVRKEVALKLLRGDGGGSAFAQALVEEARLAARLTHTNVVQVFELVEEAGRHAIAMELVRGRDLGRVLDRGRELGQRLGLARAVHVAAEVARGLDYAHRLTDEAGRLLGLVHRDVSPHNILISFEGEVKLTDFGIARAMSQSGLTDPGTVKGKLAYMAPEQARGEVVDGRADVFALGVVLWELCTGRRLFARDAEAATLAALLGDEPISPPSAWNEAVPPELDEAVLGALARDPARRPASAGALCAALAEVRHRLARRPDDVDLRGVMRRLWPEGDAPRAAPEPTAVRPAAPSPGPAAQAAAAAVTATLVRPGRGRVVGLAVAALGLLAVAAGLRWWRAPPPAAPVAAVAGPAPAAGDAVRSPAAGDPDEGGPPLALDPEVDAAAAARREGRVAVRVHPWATVSVDGLAVGETPRELRLGIGRHLLRASHPTLGAAELELSIEPGRRHVWRPALRK